MYRDNQQSGPNKKSLDQQNYFQPQKPREIKIEISRYTSKIVNSILAVYFTGLNAIEIPATRVCHVI